MRSTIARREISRGFPHHVYLKAHHFHLSNLDCESMLVCGVLRRAQTSSHENF